MNEGVEWAAHCAVVLAALPDGAALSAQALAEYHGVPRPYLAKSLQALSREGIVAAQPGRTGGYYLARPAAEITLLDVVHAVEGRRPAFTCTEIRQRGPIRSPAETYRAPCRIKTAMRTAERAWADELRRTTIAGLAAEVAAHVPPETLLAGATWLAGRVGRSPA